MNRATRSRTLPKLARTITGPGAPSGRTALFLYVLLVVLPAVVFGGLLWRQLQQFQSARLAELPLECRDAADRLARRCIDRVEKLRNDEMQRPFEHYGEDFFVDDLGPVRAQRSLVTGKPQPGVLGHFAFRVVDDPIDREDGIAVAVLRGQRADDDDAASTLIRDVVSEALVAPVADAPFPAQVARDAARIEGFGERRERLIRSVVLNFASGNHQECVDALDRLPELRDNVSHTVHVQYFELQPIPLGASQAPLLLGTRQVTAEQLPEFQLLDRIDAINKGVLIVRFALDPDWLHVLMPREEAVDVLGFPSVSCSARASSPSARGSPSRWSTSSAGSGSPVRHGSRGHASPSSPTPASCGAPSASRTRGSRAWR